MEKKIQIIVFETLSKESKIEMVSDIMQRIKKLLLNAMLKPEQSSILDKVIEDILDFYSKNLA